VNGYSPAAWSATNDQMRHCALVLSAVN